LGRRLSLPVSGQGLTQPFDKLRALSLSMEAAPFFPAFEGKDSAAERSTLLRILLKNWNREFWKKMIPIDLRINFW
jgi:hypothetical protein